MAKNETKVRKPRVPHVKTPLELKIDAAHKASQQPVKVLRKISRILGTMPAERQREVIDELGAALS